MTNRYCNPNNGGVHPPLQQRSTNINNARIVVVERQKKRRRLREMSPPQRTRRVRFHPEVAVYHKAANGNNCDSDESSSLLPLSSSSTWLSKEDFSRIYNGILWTLNQMTNAKTNNDCDDHEYCPRGLEEYSPMGSLKGTAIRRRQAAVHAVLSEQSVQRKAWSRSRQPGKNKEQLSHNPNQKLQFMPNDSRIRYEYLRETRNNANASLAMGATDSFVALSVYKEQCF